MKARLISAIFVLALAAVACNLPGAPAATPTGVSALVTQMAATLQALETPAAKTPAAGSATPSLIPPPSQTPAPPAAGTATPTSQPCDQAQFIADVTAPDGSLMIPGQAFTKTWRLRNLGSCAWGNGYALVFQSGDALGAPAVVNLPGEVPSGATVDVSVEMKAPSAPGNYKGYWKLRGANGQTFGVLQNQPFYVDINVVAPTLTATQTVTPTTAPSGVIYDFTANKCAAEWLSKAGEAALACPGSPGDPKGYVVEVSNPTLEGGTAASGAALLTAPRSEANGVITGRFPALTIASGYRFKAVIGCLDGNPGCSVTYQVNYRLGGELRNLGQWTQTSDGSVQTLDIDLSSLAGKSVEMVLAVLAGESAEQDQAVWVQPRIER